MSPSIILHFISYRCCFAFFLSTETIKNLQLHGAAQQKPIDSPPKGSVWAILLQPEKKALFPQLVVS